MVVSKTLGVWGGGCWVVGCLLCKLFFSFEKKNNKECIIFKGSNSYFGGFFIRLIYQGAVDNYLGLAV